jgi:hypothetical protein
LEDIFDKNTGSTTGVASSFCGYFSSCLSLTSFFQRLEPWRELIAGGREVRLPSEENIRTHEIIQTDR